LVPSNKAKALIDEAYGAVHKLIKLVAEGEQKTTALSVLKIMIKESLAPIIILKTTITYV